MHDHLDEAISRAIAAMSPEERDLWLASLRRWEREQERLLINARTPADRDAADAADQEWFRMTWILRRVETLLGETSS